MEIQYKPFVMHSLSWSLAFIALFLLNASLELGERGGSVVECRTPEREVRGSRPTAAVLCPWARHFTPRKYWLITQEAMAPSRYDWKIVDWDVKPQHNQILRTGFYIPLPPPSTYLPRGGIMFSCPSIRTFLFFNILKKQWRNFIKFGKHIHIHKMNIYNRKIRARGQFC